ncbi:conserved protein of unknown function [Ectopseudomonas oleovorans]|uniref:Uncharacterized protein n=1 Tax=Ectopseudomonas oleovorans TaxID=301 RepID=A0A653BC80_ECTOL|nr:conserved protein of unknown function [Pseudomonas oleovorans]
MPPLTLLDRSGLSQPRGPYVSHKGSKPFLDHSKKLL